MPGCDWQPVITAIAVFIGALTPGVAALIVALGNRAQLKQLPMKRATDVINVADIRTQLAALAAQLTENGGGGSGRGPS